MGRGAEDAGAEPAFDQADLLVTSGLALVVGALTGVVGALYRLALEAADRFRGVIVAFAQGEGLLGFTMLVAICAAAAFIAAWMVRRFSPHASGSGIPHVEAVLRGMAAPADFILLPVKFIGGVLAIGSGLALGREGPSVQIGAVIGHLVGSTARRGWPDCRALLAAGAGAGLATAFNAPMAGAVFVLEELVQKFEHRTALTALAASSTAIATAHFILGDALEFRLPPLDYPEPAVGPLFFVLGVAMGFLGIFYNWLLLRTLDVLREFLADADRTARGRDGRACRRAGVVRAGTCGRR